MSVLFSPRAATERGDDALKLAPGTLVCGAYVVGLPIRYGSPVATYTGHHVDDAAHAVVITAIRVGSSARAVAAAALTASASLSHPALPPVLAAESTGTVARLVSEAARGPTLHEEILARGPLGGPEVARIVTQVAGALDYLHAAVPGSAHRLLSPARVILAGPARKAMLVDAPLAVALARGGAESLITSLQDESPGYVAPEEISGEAPASTAARDVYVLASIVYECVTGEVAFDARTRDELLDMMRSTTRPMASGRGGVARAVDAALLRAWAVWPEARHRGAAHLAAELVRALAGIAARGTPVLGARRRSTRGYEAVPGTPPRGEHRVANSARTRRAPELTREPPPEGDRELDDAVDPEDESEQSHQRLRVSAGAHEPPPQLQDTEVHVGTTLAQAHAAHRGEG